MSQYKIERLEPKSVHEKYWSQIQSSMNEASSSDLSLQKVQAHFLHQLRYPFSSEQAERELLSTYPSLPPLEDWLLGNSRQEPEERLQVYKNAYFTRLHEVIKDTFSKTAQLFSDEDFHNCIVDYLLLFPSTHPDVHAVGGKFPMFLRDYPRTGAPPWISELALLEWTRSMQVFAPDSPVLTRSMLNEYPPETWGEMSFSLISAVQLIHAQFPVARIWKALFEGEDTEELQRNPTSILVWRMPNFSIAHTSLSAEQEKAFQVLQKGLSFSHFCEAFLPNSEDSEDVQKAIGNAFNTFASWLDEGLFSKFVIS